MKPEDLPGVPCPACGETKLRIEMRLVAKKLGTFSIAGSQMKVVASEVPFLVCDGCGIEAQGEPTPDASEVRPRADL